MSQYILAFSYVLRFLEGLQFGLFLGLMVNLLGRSLNLTGSPKRSPDQWTTLVHHLLILDRPCYISFTFKRPLIDSRYCCLLSDTNAACCHSLLDIFLRRFSRWAGFISSVLFYFHDFVPFLGQIGSNQIHLYVDAWLFERRKKKDSGTQNCHLADSLVKNEKIDAAVLSVFEIWNWSKRLT